MQWNILIFFSIYSISLFGGCVNGQQQTSRKVLIIGSSLPVLRSALILTDVGYSVTLQYATLEIENAISGVTTVVQNLAYRLPRSHPVIYEHSATAKNLAYRFGITFMQEDELYVRISDDKDLPLSANEFILMLLFSAADRHCITLVDIFRSHKVIKALKDYDYATYRALYSNITLAQFAQIMDTPPQTLSCLLKSALIDTGHQVDVINAADAIARMHFYYFKGKNGLRSYHMKNPYTSETDSKILVDQIIERLKSQNTIFISNNSIEAFWVDTDSGRVLGDYNNRTIKYDYIILGDTLTRSRRILSNTQQYYSNASNIFQPLDKILNILNQYSNPPTIISLKLWLSENINMNGKSMLQVNNSPLPFSIQSIKQINKLSGDGNPGNILEVIIANPNPTSDIDWKKIFTEISDILPEMKDIKIFYSRYDIIDTGVLMDTNYGNNRLSTASLIQFGMSNIILGADWIDAINNDAVDLEKSVEIGYQAAFTILTDLYSQD